MQKNKFTFGTVNKLKNKKDISQLFKNGKYLFSSSLKCVYILQKNSNKSENKWGVSVPKNLIRKAYQRNIIKRILRELLRKEIHFFDDKNINCKVFIIYNISEIKTYNSLKIELEKIIKKLKIKC